MNAQSEKKPVRDRLIVALDVPDVAAAGELIDLLAPYAGLFKIGPTLFTREGPRVCERVRAAGVGLFLDLKFHDIPNTVAGAVRAASAIGCDMLTLHAAGGPEMISRAREAAVAKGADDMILLAVTVLTSFEGAAFRELFRSTRESEDTVVDFARMAIDAGATGVVSSARELPGLRAALGPDTAIVTPGIRLPGAVADDQARVVTPERALADGASYLVVGRPIIAADDPVEAVRNVLHRMTL